jgi:hypothetical protein
VWAGDLGARQTHGVEGLIRIIEAGRQKTLLGIFTENRVTSKRIMHRDVHDVALVKA